MEDFGSAVGLEHTEREALVTQRIGQAAFKRGVTRYWSGRCCVTGISESALLRASHIRDWARCNSDRERLTVFNGLLLAAHVDAAFDAGLVTFDETGTMLISKGISASTRSALGLVTPVRIRKLTNRHNENLVWHRQNKFVDR